MKSKSCFIYILYVLYIAPLNSQIKKKYVVLKKYEEEKKENSESDFFEDQT